MQSYFLTVAANVVLLLHFAYVSFVVLGLIAILIGLALGKPWARSPELRIAHLTAIVIVAIEALLGITCPLTTWEHQLRAAAGQPTTDGDFIAEWVHRVMFFDLPPWVFTTIYVAFGLLILVIFWAAPPRWRRT